MIYVKTHVVARHNARGGRTAQEHLVTALRCLYRRAVGDALLCAPGRPDLPTALRCGSPGADDGMRVSG
jgi:integrase/recombinase XerC